MIFFLAPRNVLFCMEAYVLRNRAQLEGLVTSISYDQILDRGEFQPGSYIFAALDQVTATERQLIIRAWDLLTERVPEATLMNDPRRVLLRYDLLQAAYETGASKFRVSRASQFPWRVRFPAFVRCEWEHTGSLTPLLYSSAQVAFWLARLAAGGFQIRDLLIAEFLNTADREGRFRKYAAMRVKNRIVPRALVVNRDWVAKDEGRLLSEDLVREEYDYLDQNPHEAWLRRVFERGGIDYGRADYTILDGQPQLWEINTNPTVGTSQNANPAIYNPARDALTPGRDIFRRRFQEALFAVNYTGPETQSVDINVSDLERKLLMAERERMARIAAHHTWISRTVGPPIRRLRALQGASPRSSALPAEHAREHAER